MKVTHGGVEGRAVPAPELGDFASNFVDLPLATTQQAEATTAIEEASALLQNGQPTKKRKSGSGLSGVGFDRRSARLAEQGLGGSRGLAH